MGKLVVFDNVSVDGFFVDELQLVVNPLVLGAGRTLFDGVRAPVAYKLKGTRAFKNGNVVLTYAPAH